MIRTLPVACAFVLLVPLACVAEAQVRGATERKTASAVRVSGGAIEVDGRLDEAVWREAQPITDFVQKEPVEGAPPTERMEVRFAYDNGALFVGARMFSSNPNAIQAPMARRDDGTDQAEHVLVSLDTFLDRRTAYTFGVTAGGVRLDRYHSSDDDDFDAGFDPVWEARTRIDELGWTAELWIPFAQLRFNDVPEQVWGLNVVRFTPSLNEEDYWIAVPRTERAWASRFGDLRGIGSLGSTRRLELLPVIVGSSAMNGQRDLNNPFDNGRNLASRFGTDMKMGLGPSLTLNLTINPDFGQVEADPAEVNLTAFATRFSERRPFFTEGSQLLNLSSHPNVFYSRRIGLRPVGPASGDFVDYPQDSTILAAGKITGRLRSGTSIGILSAVTDQEYARTSDEGLISKVRVAPRTMFGLARVQQEFGRSGSTANVLIGTVHRDLKADDPLAALVPRNAVIGAGDALLRFKGAYELRTAVVGSYLAGEPAAVERVQRSSAHYMQRPDKQYAQIDPTRTSLAGISTQTTFDRISGRHWLFGTYLKIDTPGFDTNDIAQLNAADGFQPNMNITYRETRPGKILRSYSIRVNQNSEWNFGWERQNSSAGTNVNVTWANFWTSSINVSRSSRTLNAGLTRGGPLMGTPHGWSTTLNFGNRVSAQTRVQGTIGLSENERGGTNRRMNTTFSFRPGPQWQLSVRPSYDRTTDAQQYVSTLSGGRPETYGSRYVFAYIERSTFSTQFRLGFTLKPDVNFDFYAEPFAASGRYYDYGELAAAGSHARLIYGTAPGTTVDVKPDGSQAVMIGDATLTLSNRDFNVRSFRSNAVLRWEWRPGSTMYIVWQQNREARETFGSRVSLGDMLRSVSAPGSNILLVKTSFWIPVG